MINSDPEDLFKEKTRSARSSQRQSMCFYRSSKLNGRWCGPAAFPHLHLAINRNSEFTGQTHCSAQSKVFNGRRHIFRISKSFYAQARVKSAVWHTSARSRTQRARADLISAPAECCCETKIITADYFHWFCVDFLVCLIGRTGSLTWGKKRFRNTAGSAQQRRPFALRCGVQTVCSHMNLVYRCLMLHPYSSGLV